MRGAFYTALLGAKTAEDVATALATALQASYPNAVTPGPARARDICLYCKADTTDARVGGNCHACGAN